MEVVLIRHGRTAANVEQRYCGVSDLPLCAEGMQEATAAGTYDNVDLVYCSPMLRARQTAALLFPRAQLQTVEGLQEMNFGRFEGYTATELAADADYCAWVASDCRTGCPNGESLADFAARVGVAMRNLLAAAAHRGESHIIVVAHGGVLMGIMAQFADPNLPYFGWGVSNCHGYRAEYRPEQPQRFSEWKRIEQLAFLATIN